MTMITGHKLDLEAREVPKDHAINTVKRIVYGPGRTWDSHVMRIFTMGEGGGTFEHAHEWPHWVYVLGGRGIITFEGKEYPVEAGHYMHIPGDTMHRLHNAGTEPFEFMCIVPPEGDPDAK